MDKQMKAGKNLQIRPKEELLKNRLEEFRYLVYKNYKIIYWVNTIKNRVDVALLTFLIPVKNLKR